MRPLDLAAFFPPDSGTDETAEALARCLRLAAQRGRAIRAARELAVEQPTTTPSTTPTTEAKHESR